MAAREVRRTLFVGDVHGCRVELDLLLEKARWIPGDLLVLVGDLVAKGPDSAGVLRRVRELNGLAVMGNHDLHVVRARKKPAKERAQLKEEHRQVLETLGDEDFALLESLPKLLKFPEWNLAVLHAGAMPGMALENQPEEHLLYLRSITKDGQPSKRANDGASWASHWKGPEKIIFGHDAKRGLQKHPFALGLDTGCVYGGALTGYLMPDDTLVSVKATAVHFKPE